LSCLAAVIGVFGEIRGRSPQYFTSLISVGQAAMQRSEWDFHSTVDESDEEVAWPKSPEEFMDRFGVRTALLVLCIACFIAAIWLVSGPSFEKCSALENVVDRNACFDTLRNDSLKPPAKGAAAPKQ